MFVDKVKVFVKAGRGGDGCISFRREKFVPKGGPDGGDGGNGGNVIVRGNKHLNNLNHLFFKKHWFAGDGEHGRGKNQHGAKGEDCIIEVPTGTVIYEGDKLIGEILYDGQEIIVAKGGKGGRGNTHFKSPTRQAPRIRERGKPGEEKWLTFELKLIADVGIVGLPNAGKSTLLKCISNAEPKIADYPFTTLSPNLGVVEIDHKRITFADIPGIIEGAHEGKGLGLDFLRHIERTKVLLYLLDITSDPARDFAILQNEIREYNPMILKKPYIIALNKIDLVKEIIKFDEAIPISALKVTGIDELLKRIKEKIEEVEKYEREIR